jgi:hypothetical protein
MVIRVGGDSVMLIQYAGWEGNLVVWWFGGMVVTDGVTAKGLGLKSDLKSFDATTRRSFVLRDDLQSCNFLNIREQVNSERGPAGGICLLGYRR